MAGDAPTPDDPNKIDISLSLLSGQSGLAFEKFVQELEGLRKGIEALTKFTPDTAARAARAAAEFYQAEQGRPSGLSANASRATTASPSGQLQFDLSPQSQLQLFDLQSAQRTQYDEDQVRRQRDREARTALGEGYGTYRSTHSLGQAFDAFTKKAFHKKPLDINAATGYTTHDEEEADGGGAPPDGSGRSRRSMKEEWYGRASEQAINAPLKMPRAGHFTAEDVLNTAAQYITRGALNRRAKAGEDLGIYRDSFANNEEGYAAYQDALAENLGGVAGQNPGDTLGNIGALTYKAAHQWAPKAALIKQYYDRYVGITPGQLLTSGYEQGASGDSGDINIGPLGLRTPFSGAGLTGFQTEWQNFKSSLGAGINREQAASIQAATINSGRALHDPQHDPFYNTLKNIVKWNPAIGQNGTTAEMLDKVMRYGGETSLKRFVETMKQIPDAAKAAHVHINQMVQDMSDMGEFNRSQGGTFYSGMQAAQNFALSTGLPAALLPGLSQNQFVQTQGFLETGYAPWQQGLMSPTQRTQASVDSILRMAPMVAGYSQARKGHTDSYGFTSGGATQQQMEAANLHMMFPELPTSAISDILKNGKKMKAQSQLVEDMRGVSHAVKGDEAWANRYKDYKNAIAGLRSSLPSEQKSAQEWLDSHPWAASHGHELHNRAIHANADMQKLLAGSGKRSWGALRSEMSHAGFSAKDISDVEKAGRLPPSLFTGDAHIDATKIAQARQHKLEQIVSKHAGKFNNDLTGPKITIELGKAAAKKFNLQMDSASQAKLAAGAGMGAVNSAYGTGPTAITDPYG